MKKTCSALTIIILLIIALSSCGAQAVPPVDSAIVTPAVTSAATPSPTEEPTQAVSTPAPTPTLEGAAPEPTASPATEATPAPTSSPTPAPTEKPTPVEPKDIEVTEVELKCKLSVSCEMILNNWDKLNPDKHELIPADGIIFPLTEVTFYEGETVFNVLQREMKKNKLHLEFVNTPLNNSYYIEGINNIYEYDCGELSGWTFKVNGWFSEYGCSRFLLKDGDVIEWVYTCDLGRDVGDGYFGDK